MLKLMIVDDEEILRNGLVYNIPWEERGLQIVGTARNGKEAVEKIPLLMPNLILSDVQMPFMNGLELAEYVSKTYPYIKLILLTAFEIFEYAQRALKYGVTSYILKYESNEKILEELEQAAEKYLREQKAQELVREGRKHMNDSLARDLCWESMSKKEIRERMEECRWEKEGVQYVVLMFQFKDTGRERMLERLNHTRNLVEKLEEELKKYRLTTYSFFDGSNTIFLAEQKEEKDWDTILETLEITIRNLEKKEKVEILCSTDCAENDPGQIHIRYQHAKEALEKEKLLVRTEYSPRIVRYGTSRHGQGQGAEIIEKIKKFIKIHYGEEKLSLNMIADEVFLTSNYISTLFKKQENMTIGDYIMKVRISRTQELLNSTNYKTYEIANLVGYTNSQYFSVLFKRITGYSPTEYKQEQKNRGEEL